MDYNKYVAETLAVVADGISKLNEAAGIEEQEDHDGDECDNCKVHQTDPECGL